MSNVFQLALVILGLRFDLFQLGKPDFAIENQVTFLGLVHDGQHSNRFAIEK